MTYTLAVVQSEFHIIFQHSLLGPQNKTKFSYTLHKTSYLVQRCRYVTFTS